MLYGHFGQGLVHCRVDFELTSQQGVTKFHAFLDEATELVAHKHHGSLSGEHGDGQSKAEFLEKMFGAELVHAFAEFKNIWDPDGKMNPGKIVRPRRANENLRLGVVYVPAQPEDALPVPGGRRSFAHATLRCVGVGKCRNLNSQDGAACARASWSPKKSGTRPAGARTFCWRCSGGGPIEGGFRDEAVKESLDLCLACKGCKGDCPVNVDIATYKAEFLSHYYARRLRPRSAYAFGLIDRWARLAAVAPASSTR